MSEIIRDVIVRMKLEQQKAKVEAPDMGPTTRAYEQDKKAADESKKAHAERNKEVERGSETSKRFADDTRSGMGESSRATKQFGYESAAAFREGAEGAARMVRGIAFLSASGQKDMRALLETVLLAQGGFDVAAGGLKVFMNLSRVAGPQAAGAITLVTAAVTAGSIAWQRWKREAEEAAQAAQKEMQRVRSEIIGVIAAQRESRRAAEDIRIDAALTPGESARRRESARQRAAIEARDFEARGVQGRVGRSLRELQEEGPLPPPSRIRAFDSPTDRPMLEGQLRFEREAAEALKRSRDMEIEAYKRNAHNLQELATGVLDVGVGGARLLNQFGVPGVPNDFKLTQFTLQGREKIDTTIAALDKPLEKIIAAFERAAERIDRIERQLNIANSE